MDCKTHNFPPAIAHQSWIDYMDNPSKGLTGAVCDRLFFDLRRAI